MAFHPFRTFQKHRRKWLAAATILAMVTFIFAGSGLLSGGDFFSWASQALGGRGKFETVVKLYGKRINTIDVRLLREKRTIANDFMRSAVSESHGRVLRDFQRSLDKFGPVKDVLNSYVTQILQPQRPLTPQDFGFYLSQIASIQRGLDAGGKKSEARLVGELVTVLDLVKKQSERQQRNDGYFGGSTSVEDLLDFTIWLHQADRLGINLTPADVRKQLQLETFDRIEDNDFALFLQNSNLRRRSKLTFEELNAALTDEFRVRLAQEALVGYEPGVHGLREKSSPTNDVPAAVTPYEFWNFYKDNVIPSKLALLRLPVKEFVSKDDQPTEKDLDLLFKQYKEKEPSPERDKPGFKQPRRVAVEWVSARPDSEFYQRGSQIVAALTQVTLPAAYHAALLENYG